MNTNQKPLIRETRSVPRTIKFTPTEITKTESQAALLEMPFALYAHDKIVNGNERNRFAKRKICKALIQAGKSIDEIFNIIAESDSGYVQVDQILPALQAAKKGCESIC